MSKRYTIPDAPSTAGTGPVTAANVIASTAIRPMIYEFNVGISTTPADQTYKASVTRATGVGTAGSNPTPTPIDNGDVACVSTAGITHSAEPTTLTDLFGIRLNQRASYRWVCQDGAELICPAATSNNIGVRMKLASASSTMETTIFFKE